jgi:hypothetical protein
MRTFLGLVLCGLSFVRCADCHSVEEAEKRVLLESKASRDRTNPLLGRKRLLQELNQDDEMCERASLAFLGQHGNADGAYWDVLKLIREEIAECVRDADDPTCYIDLLVEDSEQAVATLYDECSAGGGVFVSSNCSFLVVNSSRRVKVAFNANCADDQEYCHWDSFTNYSLSQALPFARDGSCVINNVTRFAENATGETGPQGYNESVVDQCTTAVLDLRSEHPAIVHADDSLTDAFMANAETCYRNFVAECSFDFQEIENGQLFSGLIVACVEAGGVVLSLSCNMRVTPSSDVLHIMTNYGFCVVSQEEYPPCDANLFVQLALPDFERNCTVTDVYDGVNYNITLYFEQCMTATRNLARSNPSLEAANYSLIDSMQDAMYICSLSDRFNCSVNLLSPGFSEQYWALEQSCSLAGGTFVSANCTFTDVFNGVRMSFEILHFASCFADDTLSCDPSRYADVAFLAIGGSDTVGKCVVNNELISNASPSPSTAIDNDSPPTFKQCASASSDLFQDNQALLVAFNDFASLLRNELVSCTDRTTGPCRFDLKVAEQGQVYEAFLGNCTAVGGVFFSTNCSYSAQADGGTLAFEINYNAHCVVAKEVSRFCDPEKYDDYSFWLLSSSDPNGKCILNTPFEGPSPPSTTGSGPMEESPFPSATIPDMAPATDSSSRRTLLSPRGLVAIVPSIVLAFWRC